MAVDRNEYRQNASIVCAIATLNNSDGSQYQLLMAAGVLAVLPMLVIYAICQEYFMDGIMSSGVKG